MPLPLEQWLRAAIALAEAVDRIHQQRLIHTQINPDNIVWNAESGRVTLIDPHPIDATPERTITSQPRARREETAAYLSPEQTGRMNRVVDYRTDFYSLGVTLYQLLTGRLPFTAADTLGIIHQHIAGIPISPHALNPALPDAVSNIVLKLLAKMADERYQSARGLKADLVRCLNTLHSTGVITPFELGQEDDTDRFAIPQKLYGREHESKQMLDAIERVSGGRSELFLVAGYAGIGKTALVHEMHRLIAERNGYFLEGKFDQLQRNVPYYAWIQSLAGFMKYLLMESEQQLRHMKARILESVGSIGKVLTDVIPNLTLIIGAQPDVPALGAAEAHNRFTYVFTEFIRAIATQEHPLVIFLDDLQWIDTASLNLLQTVTSNPDITSLLLIGAYRDNEVDALHPLARTIELLRQEETDIHLLTLANLSRETVNEMISDTLHEDVAQTVALTDLIYAKTGGNPFFMLQTLAALAEQHVIAYSVERRRWQWDLSALRRVEICDNVVDLMLEKIRKLTPQTQQVLTLAACIGYRFSAENVSIIAELTEDRTVEILQSALCEGLIVPSEETFQFAHDRIQQAAYSLIPEADRKSVHLKIGRLLLHHRADHNREQQLFTVVDHLNIGAELMTTSEERCDLARMNMQAGVKAKAAAAFSAAAEYFHFAIHLLPSQPWEHHYRMILLLYRERAECEYLRGRHDEALELIGEAILHAQNDFDKAGLYSIQAALYTTQTRYADSIEVGIAALKLLGQQLPDMTDNESMKCAAKASMEQCRDHLRAIEISSITNEAEMTDPVARTCMDLLMQMVLAAYFLNRDVYTLLIATMVNLSLRFGNSSAAALGYVLMAAISITDFNDFRNARALGNLALELIKSKKSSALESKILQFYCNTVAPWFLPLSEVIALQRRAVLTAMESGSLNDAANDLWGIFRSTLTASTTPLDETIRECDALIAFAEKIHAQGLHDGVVFLRQGVSYFQKQSSAIEPEANEVDEASALRYFEQLGFLTIPAHYNIFRAWSLFILGAYEEAFIRTEANIALIGSIADQPTSAYHYFHYSLLLLRAHTTGSQNGEIVRKNQKILQRFSKHCPENYRHLFLLVEAEQARVEGRIADAIHLYDEAIDASAVNKSNYVEGMACEFAARFWLTLGKQELVAQYLKRAHLAFHRWRAWAKVSALEAEFPQWLAPPCIGTPAERKAGSLDLDTVMKAAIAISSEIEMPRLLSEVMHHAIENAGAQRGSLLMQKKGAWVIVAQGGIERTTVKLDHPVAMDERGSVSAGVVRFVARTRERILLDDAASKGEFVSDPYIRHHKCKSLLCVPLLSRGRLIGILYVENNLTVSAFTPERIQLLEVLLSQAAISLENAQVYEALKESEARYRRIVNTANEGIWMLGPDARTIFVNARMTEMLGCKTEEILGRPMTDFMYEEDIPDHLKKMQNRQNGLAEHYERRFCRKDGATLWAVVSATPVFDNEHHFVGAFGMFTDHTERKQAELEIRNYRDHLEDLVKERTAELQTANKDLESFSYSVSHDLRTPLRAISGYSQILRDDYAQNLSGDAVRLLSSISTNVERMNQLIEDLLQLSRSTRQELVWSTVVMEDLVKSVFEEQIPLAPERAIEVTVNELPSAHGDSSLLRQVWDNLISNAIKYTRYKDPAKIEVGSFKQGHAIIYYIRDNGAGFDMAYKDKLFGVFQRLHSRESFEGTGIGLATIAKIIQKHKGRVWAEAKENEGATFYFTLG